MIELLVKRPEEERLYTMDLSEQPEIVAGDTVASVVSITCMEASGAGTVTAAITDLTLTVKAVSSDPQGAQCMIAGGVDKGVYLLKFVVLTTAGAKLGGRGRLRVEDD